MTKGELRALQDRVDYLQQAVTRLKILQFTEPMAYLTRYLTAPLESLQLNELNYVYYVLEKLPFMEGYVMGYEAVKKGWCPE